MSRALTHWNLTCNYIVRDFERAGFFFEVREALQKKIIFSSKCAQHSRRRSSDLLCSVALHNVFHKQEDH